MNDVLEGTLDSSPVFDITVDLAGAPGGCVAMDERPALEVLFEV